MIYLRALGAIDVHASDGSRVEQVLAQPKRLALLAYLLLSRPRRGHTRDELIALFWPESDDRRARDALSQAMQFLRRHLGNDIITSRGELVELDTPIRCDALELEAAVHAGQWTRSVAMYAGDLFPGLHAAGAPGFAEWVDRERARFRHMAAEAAVAAADEQAGEAHLAEAIRFARRAVEIEPLDEEPVRRLIGFLRSAGEGAMALREYEALKARLAAELGVAPSPDTQAALERPVDRLIQAAPAPKAVAPGPRPVKRHREARPLTGRVWVLAAIATVGIAWAVAESRREAEPPPTALIPDFVSGADSLLGPAVAELLRVDATRSGALRVPPRPVIGSALGRMNRGMAELGEEEVARELATREGYGALLLGEVAPLGSGYALTARVIRPATGEVIERFRAVSGDADGFTAAVESLSRDVLRTIGRSRSALKDQPPLAQVTTKSLGALRAFTAGERLFQQGRGAESLPFFEEAVRLDSSFATAYLRLRSVVGAQGANHERVRTITERIERHKHRLPPVERLAFGDDLMAGARTYEERRARTLEALKALETHVAIYPHDLVAMVRLADLYYHEREFALCEEVLERVIAGAARDSTPSPVLHEFLADTRFMLGDPEGARAAAAELRDIHGEIYMWIDTEAELAYLQGDPARAHSLMSLAVERGLDVPAALVPLTHYDVVLGRFREAEAHQAHRTAVLDSRIVATAVIREAAKFSAALVMSAGDTARAVARLDSVLASFVPGSYDPKDLPHDWLAYFYLVIGDRARSVRHHAIGQSVATEVPTLPPGPGSLGEVDLHTGDTRLAEAHLRTAVRWASTLSPLWELDYTGSLGAALEANGKVDEAIEVLERYLAIPAGWRYRIDSIHLVPTLHRLARLHEARGEPERAAQYLERFAELWKDADAELQPKVRAAREKAAALRVEARTSMR